MKYCSPCRLRAKDEEENCSRCGGELRMMGGAPSPTSAARPTSRKTQPTSKREQTNSRSATTTAAPAKRATKPRSAQKPEPPEVEATPVEGKPGDIQFQLAGLEKQVSKYSRRVRILAALAALLVVSFGGLLWHLHNSYVMQFAEIDQLEITRSQLHSGSARIRFRPLTAGRIQLIRNGGGRQETLLEYAAGPSPEGEFKEFNWTGDADDTWSISVRFRDGSELVDREWDSKQFGSGGQAVLASAL